PCEFLPRDLERLRRVLREIVVVRNQLMVGIVSEAGFTERLSLKFRESACSFRSSACPLQGFREGVQIFGMRGRVVTSLEQRNRIRITLLCKTNLSQCAESIVIVRKQAESTMGIRFRLLQVARHQMKV